MESLHHLAIAIFLQALRDAQRGDVQAQSWLLEDSPGFSFWCEVAGICPEKAHSRFGKALRNGYAGTLLPAAQKKERVRQALREHPELSSREIGRRLGVSYDLVGKVRQGP